MLSSRFECHIFYVLYPFVTYLLTLPRTYQKQVALVILVAAKSSGELIGGGGGNLQLHGC
jgi:hypothetical protein